MYTNKIILIHKDKQILNDIVKKISGFCVSMEFVSERVLLIDSYLTTEEVCDVCKNVNIKVFSAEKDALSVDMILEKISKSGVNSLRNEEYYFLTLSSTK
jgi:hypothetical protein